MNMLANIKLGDWYYTKDINGDVAGYIFVARQGQFILGVPERLRFAGRIGEQLQEMCDECFRNGFTECIALHHESRCFRTFKEAKTTRV